MQPIARRVALGTAVLTAGTLLVGCSSQQHASLVDTAPFVAGNAPSAPLVLGAGDAIGWSMYSTAYADSPAPAYAGVPKVNFITANVPTDY